jgi:hypothetical protein
MKEGNTLSFVNDKGTVSVIKWMDKRPVCVGSNYEDPWQTVSVLRRQRGQQGKVPKRIPKIISDYNSLMGGVDLTDQRKERYEIDHRAKSKFYLRIFFDLLDIAVCNAYVLHKKLNVEEKMDSLTFRRGVAMSLIGPYCSRERPTFTNPPTKRFREGNSTTSLPMHLAVFSEERRCAHCSSRVNDCRSNIKCPTCDVHLCLGASRQCFSLYHNK